MATESIGRKSIFRLITGEYLIARIVKVDDTQQLGGGMKLPEGGDTMKPYRIAEIIECKVGVYSPGDYIVALPSRAVDNFKFLGEKITYIHPDDVLGILSDEKRQEIQESASAGSQQRTP